MIHVSVLNYTVVEMSSVKVWHLGKHDQAEWVVSCSNPYDISYLWLSKYFNMHPFGVNLNDKNNTPGYIWYGSYNKEKLLMIKINYCLLLLRRNGYPRSSLNWGIQLNTVSSATIMLLTIQI